MTGSGAAKFGLYVSLSAVDVASNGAAGAAAFSTVLDAMGDVTMDEEARVVRIGAFVGFLKAGMIAFVGLSQFADPGCFASLFLLVLGTSFAVALVCTVQASYLLSGELPPKELLISAVVAAIPLMSEAMGMYFPIENYLRRNAEGGVEYANPYSSIWAYCLIVPWDALGGYTFARMAQNQGMVLCELKSAAAAGAAFGGVALIPKLVAYIAWAGVHDREMDI